MAPPRLPPDLIHDVAGEILLRIPPDEPAHLFRASLVCDLWFRVATDPAFRRRYRAFHPSAPLLGFFYNRPLAPSPCFVSTTAASPLPQGASVPRASSVLDCRHGRVLLAKKGSRDLLVWDPITDGWWELRAPDVICFCSAVVLCAVAGCNHHDCGSGPFVVVCVATDDLDSCIRACVYSSEARAWDKPASAQLDRVHFTDIEHAVLIGDGIYWTVAGGYRILKYDLVKHCFSLINPPGGSPVLMQNEDGSLGLAGVRDSRLYLWSRMVNPEGVSGWVQQRVIELNKILPGNKDYIQANVIGVAEGVGILFIRTEDDTFTFELNSEQVKKVAGPRKSSSIFPFISFCTPDCARIKLPLQAEELTTTVPEE